MKAKTRANYLDRLNTPTLDAASIIAVDCGKRGFVIAKNRYGRQREADADGLLRMIRAAVAGVANPVSIVIVPESFVEKRS